jgi:hypothetical protein
MRRIVLCTAVALCAWFFWPSGTRETLSLSSADLPTSAHFAAELSIERPPLQAALADANLALSSGEFTIHPVALFEIEARVLGRRDYRSGVEARISPMDLALGWGPMADPAVLEHISISQSNRYYRWTTRQPPIPLRTIETHSANMHLIPASPAVADSMASVRERQTVRIQGYLVNVERDDGWRWRTSLTRSDTGAGACEIVLVQRIEAW